MTICSKFRWKKEEVWHVNGILFCWFLLVLAVPCQGAWIFFWKHSLLLFGFFYTQQVYSYKFLLHPTSVVKRSNYLSLKIQIHHPFPHPYKFLLHSESVVKRSNCPSLKNQIHHPSLHQSLTPPSSFCVPPSSPCCVASSSFPSVILAAFFHSILLTLSGLQKEALFTIIGLSLLPP